VLSLPRDLGRPRTLLALGRAALALDWQAMVYSGGLENRPALLRRLGRRGAILGNGPEVVEAVRDPAVLFPFLRRSGIPHPATFPGSPGLASGSAARLLWKPARSGGGNRIRRALPRERRPRGFYLQRSLRGAPGSASFVAGAGRAVLLGVTEQLAGCRELGGSDFRYGGNIAGPAPCLLSRDSLVVLTDAASALARHFGLRGLFGIDFILSAGVPHVIEINPRYTASMELFEDLSGASLLDAHLEAIDGGPLPSWPPPVLRFLAKGILYATRAVRWTSRGIDEGIDVRDRPAEGESIGPGRPICTLVTPGASTEDCRRRLFEAARLVRQALREGGRDAARAPRRRVLAPGSMLG